MSALPKPVENLLTEAAAAFATDRSRLWLVAFPAELPLNRCDDESGGLPESSPKCGKIIDGVVYLPLRCFTVVGSTGLGGGGRSVGFLIDASGKQAVRFRDFARRSGAALAAYPPPWFSVTGNASPEVFWAIALMFQSPKARREYSDWRPECRIIAEPWGASCAALRDWTKDHLSGAAQGGQPVKRTIAYALALLAMHPEWSNKQIAEEAELHRGTLSNNKKFKAAREAIKESGKKAHRQSRNRGRDMDTYED